jgi:hypothetical protein
LNRDVAVQPRVNDPLADDILDVEQVNSSRINPSPARQTTTVKFAVNGIAWSASSCLALLRPDMAVPKARPIATLRKEEST